MRKEIVPASDDYVRTTRQISATIILPQYFDIILSVFAKSTYLFQKKVICEDDASAISLRMWR